MLDNIKIRKLENGYTVKYHIEIATMDDAGQLGTKGYSKEIYVADKKNLLTVVGALIDSHIQEAV